ncbi:MAG: ABC transporter [Oligoflexia bacterium]|nr:MAG: ABC transporter [Oligoflexia bacterium]
MKTVVEAKGLVKQFADKLVVEGINLEIHRGECFGILGPNGAGKTTTMKMMYCSSLVSSGELYVLGLNVKKNHREIKARIGVIPQEDGLDVDFTAKENLLIYSSYYNIDKQVAARRVDELLRLVRLEEDKDKFIHELSGGMRRRLAIARGMINQPELLFLDEPTAGLDPQARVWIWEFLRKIKAEMGTLIITTHYMEEAEQLCDRIALMDHGKVLSVGTPKELIAKYIGKEVVEFECSQKDLNYYLNRLRELGYKYQVIGRMVNIYILPEQEGKKVFDLISSPRMTIRRPTLNDVFLSLAGQYLHEEFM